MSEAIIQVIILYLFFACVVTMIFFLVRKRMRNRLITFMLIVFLLSPSFLYVPIEIKTILYGGLFKGIDIQSGMNLPVVYYKVFSISNSEALLFFVEGENKRHEVGRFYRFKKETGEWKFDTEWRTMWTNSGGSASEFTVPPYF